MGLITVTLITALNETKGIVVAAPEHNLLIQIGVPGSSNRRHT